MKSKPVNEAQAYLTMQQHSDIHEAVDAYFRRIGVVQRTYREKHAKVVSETKRRKALEPK